MASHAEPKQTITRMTIDFPVLKHKQMKAIAALLGISMKEFVLTCVMEKLNDKKVLQAIEEERDAEAFDRGMKSIDDEGFDTLEEVRKYLGLDK